MFCEPYLQILRQPQKQRQSISAEKHQSHGLGNEQTRRLKVSRHKNKKLGVRKKDSNAFQNHEVSSSELAIILFHMSPRWLRTLDLHWECEATNM